MTLPVVIVPSRNAANLWRCVEAVRLHEPDVRIIVVDDGVDWEVYSTLQHYAFVLGKEERIPGIKPFVFARNVNIGIRAAGESDVVLLNDDALLESPGGFQLMQMAARFREDVGVIGATTNVTGQPLQNRQGNWGSYDWENPPLGMGLRLVPHIAFVCALIPRRTLNRLGSLGEGNAEGFEGFTFGLDERYCLDYGVEDADYCEQVTRAGLKVAVHDGCYVDHGSLTSTYRGDPRAAKSFAQNYRLLMEKWGKLESQPK